MFVGRPARALVSFAFNLGHSTAAIARQLRIDQDAAAPRGPLLGLRQCRVEGAKERGAGADQGTTGNFGNGHFHRLILS